MSDGEDALAPKVQSLPTPREALYRAVRLLESAEMEINLPLMERLNCLADSWIILSGALDGIEEEQ